MRSQILRWWLITEPAAVCSTAPSRRKRRSRARRSEGIARRAVSDITPRGTASVFRPMSPPQ